MTAHYAWRLAPWALGVLAVSAAAAPASAALCARAQRLFGQGLSVNQVAAALGTSPGVVQTCLQPRSAAPNGAAGPAPFGAPGPPPFGAAGPPPFGAAGPPPLGAAGPPPAPAGRNAVKTAH